jgi:hypothetical protein
MADMTIKSVVGSPGIDGEHTFESVRGILARMFRGTPGAEIEHRIARSGRAEKPARRSPNTFRERSTRVWIVFPGSGTAWDI